MHRLTLTFARLLHKAREFKKCGWARHQRKLYLSGLINGADNWQLPEPEKGEGKQC